MSLVDDRPPPPIPRPNPRRKVNPNQLELDFSAFGTPVADVARPVKTQRLITAPDLSAFGSPVETSGYMTEFAKGTARGAVNTGASAMKGAAALDPYQGAQRDIEKYRGDLERLPQMDPFELDAFGKKIAAEPSPITRRLLEVTVEDLVSGRLTPEGLASIMPPTPIAERGLYKEGEQFQEWGEKVAGAAPGWEESLTGTIGEGIGSVGAGLMTSIFAGPAVAGATFTAGGVGEAAERAIQFDKKERAEGRPGLTQEQIATAAIMGVGPGATDMIPIEFILGGLKVPQPFRRPVAQAIARIGGQAFVEGVQEGGQEFLQNLIAREGYDPSQDLGEGVIPNAGMGGTVGGLVQLPAEIVRMFTPGRQRGAGEPAGAQPGQPPVITPQNAPPVQVLTPGPAMSPPQNGAVPPSPGTPAAAPAPPIPSPPPAAGDEAAILRSAGYTDEQIADMDPAERAASVQEARDQGISAPVSRETPAAPPAGIAPPDNPSAEPLSDIEAQAKDLADPAHPRKAIYVAPETIASLKVKGGARQLSKFGVPVWNFDGKGGAMLFPDKESADRATQRAKAIQAGGRDLQGLIGELTGAGTGKPAGEAAVVRQGDGRGNVTQETLAPPDEAGAVAERLSEGGRPVDVIDPATAIGDRAARLEAEGSAINAENTPINPAINGESQDFSQFGRPAAAPEPTEAQRDAGNYRKGHIRWNGLDVSIENEKGGKRRSKAGAPEPWEVDMPGAYGYFRGTVGADGDHVDVLLGDKPGSGKAFVVNQHDLTSGEFDEHKVIADVETIAEAMDLYNRSYSDGKGMNRVGGVKAMTVEELKAWLANKRATRRPIDAPPQRRPGSLFDFLNSIGGIKDYRGELAALDLPKHVQAKIIRKGGLTLDMARELAAEQGYFDHLYGVGDALGNSTPSDLLDLIDAELRGDKQYTPTAKTEVDERAATKKVEQQEDEARRLIEAEMSGETDLELEDRAVEILLRDGGDPFDALEAATLQLVGEALTPAQKEAVNDELEIPFFGEDAGAVQASGERAGEASPQSERPGKDEATGPPAADDSAPEGGKSEIELVEDRIDALGLILESNPKDKEASAEFEKLMARHTMLANDSRMRVKIDDPAREAEAKRLGESARKKRERVAALEPLAARYEALGNTEKARAVRGMIEYPGLELRNNPQAEIDRIEADVAAREKGALFPEDSQKDQAQRKADAPLKPAVAQKPTDEGLFGDEKDQTDLVEAARGPSQTVRADDADELVTQTLTAKGPWDFNDTYPEPDWDQVERQLADGRDTFGGGEGERDIENIVGVIEETLNEIVIGHLDIRHARKRIADLKAGKIKLGRGKTIDNQVEIAEKEAARGRRAVQDTSSALLDVFSRDAVAAMRREARSRADLEWDQSGKGTIERPTRAQRDAAEAEEGRKDRVDDWAHQRALNEQMVEAGPVDTLSMGSGDDHRGVGFEITVYKNPEGGFAARQTHSMGMQGGGGGPIYGQHETAKKAIEEELSKLRRSFHATLTRPLADLPKKTAAQLKKIIEEIDKAVADRGLTLEGKRDDLQSGKSAVPSTDRGEGPDGGRVSGERGQDLGGRGNARPSESEDGGGSDSARPVAGKDRQDEGVGAKKAGDDNLPDGLAAADAGVDGAPAEAGGAAAAFRDHFLAGKGFDTIVQARRFAKEHGLEGAANKDVDEAIEHGVVIAARAIVGRSPNARSAYDELVNLYGRQPNIAVRTGKSVADQAYSTPVPLAFIASRLAGVKGAKSVLEPTAGNGALLIEALGPEGITVNEIDETRRKNLISQGFRVSSKDASEGGLRHAGYPVDAVIMNPPFGAVRELGIVKSWEFAGWRTRQIDHAIALANLSSMKDDGRAVLLLGGVKGKNATELDPEGDEPSRAEGYSAKERREFFFRLYRDYKVVNHFTIAGDLYRKQGAGWPVDVVVIEGKGKSSRSLPAVDVPHVYASWEELAKELPNDSAGNRRGANREDAPRSAAPAESSERIAAPAEGRGNELDDAAARGGRPVSREPAAEPDGGRIREERGGEQRDVARLDPVAAEQLEPAGERDGGGSRKQPTRRRERLRVDASKVNEAGQAPYQPQSAGMGLNTLVPVNVRDATRASLERVVQKHGDVDTFVASELGYDVDKLDDHFSAEQIDAVALAIDNVQGGTALIIGDQTGIGKGRVGAAMIRYAMRNGLVPVFVTEKPDLYGDMHRDLTDIGNPSLRYFMTNQSAAVPLDEAALDWRAEADEAAENGEKAPKQYGTFLEPVKDTKAAKKNIETMKAIVDGKDVADVVFTTYDQMNTVKGADTMRREFMTAIAHRAFFIFDETHNAGGQGQGNGWKAKDAPKNRAEFVRELVQTAAAVMYSSATYAKRPDVMDLFSRTDMAKAVESIDLLPELIAKGGVPLQQAVAGMLANSGQYVRRERSFEGIEYSAEGIPVDVEAYGSFTEALGEIFVFDRYINAGGNESEKVKLIAQTLAAQGAGVGKDGAIGEAGASSTEFSSVMHNLVNQMLLAIQAEPMAARAIEAFKAGEKPVIALANTMETFLADIADARGVDVGGEIDIDFNVLLDRYLERSRRITVTPAEGKIFHVMIPVADFSQEAQALYRKAKDKVAEVDLGTLPVSPIDYLRDRFTKAGMTVAEITGRKRMVDMSAKPWTLAARPKREIGPGGKRVTIGKFNNGGIDALIINKSGSTGVSAHASSKYKDQRPRRMIIAQADPNIDTFMQMLGRINRTGQVELPRYTQPIPEIPAAIRPAAILLKKMASLNANTTGARRSIHTTDALDFMNQYGDLVAVNVMADEWEINERMGGAIQHDSEGRPKIDGAMRRVTGRLTLLKPEEQQNLIDRLSAEYASMIASLDAIGENLLEAKTLDLDARVVKVEMVKEGSDEGSPFTRPVYMEQTSVKAEGRAYAPAEIVEKLFDRLETDPASFNPRLTDQQKIIALGTIGARRRDDAAAKMGQMFGTWLETERKDYPPKKREAFEKGANATRERWESLARRLYPGNIVMLTGKSSVMPAIVLDVHRAKKSGKNPLGLSAWKATFAVPDSAREIQVPFSQIFIDPKERAEDDGGFVIEPPDYAMSQGRGLLELFTEANKEGRETRYFITGNMLAGYDVANGSGRIVNYSVDGGETKSGIMMPRSFDPELFKSSRVMRLMAGVAVRNFLDRSAMGTVQTRDGYVTFTRTDNGAYSIGASAGRATGGRYYTDADVRKAVRESFEKRGSLMIAKNLTGPQVEAAADAMIRIGALFETDSDQEIAAEVSRGVTPIKRAMAGAGPPSLPFASPPPRNTDEAKRGGRREANHIGPLKAELRAIVSDVAGKDVPVLFSDTIHNSVRDAAMGRAASIAGRRMADTLGGMHTTWRHDDSGFRAKSSVEIALGDKLYPDAIGAAYHESWHEVEAWVLTDREKAILAADLARGADSRIRQHVAKLRGTPVNGFIMAMPTYELSAFAFQRYARARNEAEANPPPFLRRIFDRIIAMYARIRRALRRQRINSVEDLFGAAYRGEFGRRADRGEYQTSIAANMDPNKGRGQGDPIRSAMALPPAPVRRRAPPAPLTFYRQRINRMLATTSRRSDMARRLIQDDKIMVKRVQEDVAGGQRLPEQYDFYQAMELYYGRAGERLVDLKHDFVEPLVERLKSADISREEFDNYLYARHALERNEYIRNEIDPTNDLGSGMPDLEANTIIDAVHNGPKAADYAALAAMVDDLVFQTRERQVAAGLTDRATVDQWAARYQYYVPLRGWEGEETGDGPRTGRGFDIRGRESHRAYGRRSVADSPISYLIMQAEQSIVRAEKNRALRSLLRLVQDFPNPNLWKVVRGEYRPYIDPRTGFVQRRFMPYASNTATDDNVVGVKIGGKTTFIEFNTSTREGEDMHRAVRKMNREIGPLSRMMMSGARLFAAMQTQWNPEFVFSNAVRDVQTAVINVGDTEGGAPQGVRRRIGKDFITMKSVRAIWKALKDPASRGRYERYFEEFRHAGGKVSFIEWNDLAAIKRDLEKHISRGRMRQAVHKIGEVIERANTAVENSVRLTVYIRLRETGVTQAKAASIAKNLTVNFNRHGEWGPMINSFYVFFNAATQGMVRMGQALVNSRKVQGAAAGMVMAGLGLELLNSFLGAGDDDDEPNKYDLIPSWVKERNFIIMLPGTDGDYLMLPSTYGWNAFLEAGRNMGAAIRGAKPISTAAVDTVLTFIQAFNPLGASPSLYQLVSPTLVDPFLQTALGDRGETWYGGPIYPPKYNKNEPDSQLANDKTPQIYKTIAEELNDWSGGNAGRSGMIDVSPETLEHAFEFILGGAGRFYIDSSKTTWRVVTGEELLPEDVPIARRFSGDTDSSTALMGHFYEASDRIRAAQYEVKELAKRPEDREILKQSRERYRTELALYDQFETLREGMAESRKKKQRLQGAPNLTAAEREARITAIEEQERKILLTARRVEARARERYAE